MNILYYSNYCKHSKPVLDFLAKNDLAKTLNCICVDRRKVDPRTGQMNIILEDGNTILLPPNIHSVPALLLTKENYRSILGNAIIEYYKPQVSEAYDIATQGNGEPLGFSLGAKDIQSEAFTFYNATPDDLSAKGKGGNRPLYHYVPADGHIPNIETPPDTYKPNKISQDVTVDSLQQQRSEDINHTSQQMNSTPFLPNTGGNGGTGGIRPTI
jgi:hypothetical protein